MKYSYSENESCLFNFYWFPIYLHFLLIYFKWRYYYLKYLSEVITYYMKFISFFVIYWSIKFKSPIRVPFDAFSRRTRQGSARDCYVSLGTRVVISEVIRPRNCDGQSWLGKCCLWHWSAILWHIPGKVVFCKTFQFSSLLP